MVHNTKHKQNSRKTHAHEARAESGICSFREAARTTGAQLQHATHALARACARPRVGGRDATTGAIARGGSNARPNARECMNA